MPFQPGEDGSTLAIAQVKPHLDFLCRAAATNAFAGSDAADSDARGWYEGFSNVVYSIHSGSLYRQFRREPPRQRPFARVTFMKILSRNS